MNLLREANVTLLLSTKAHSSERMCSLSLSVSSLVSSQIMLGGFLETVSLCYITMVMLTVVSITPNAIILVMCSLPMMPAIWEAIKWRSRWKTLNGKWEVIKFGASATFAVIGIALLLLKVRAARVPSRLVSLIVRRTEVGAVVNV